MLGGPSRIGSFFQRAIFPKESLISRFLHKAGKPECKVWKHGFLLISHILTIYYPYIAHILLIFFCQCNVHSPSAFHVPRPTGGRVGAEKWGGGCREIAAGVGRGVTFFSSSYCSTTHTYIHTYIHIYIFIHIYIHIYIYIYIHIHTDTHTHIHIKTHTCTYTYTDIYRHIQTYTDIYRHIQTYTDIYRHIQTFTDIYRHIHYRQLHIHIQTYHIQTYTDIYRHIQTFTDIYIYIYIYIYIFTYIHIYIYIHTHTYIHIYIYTYIHTYIHILPCVLWYCALTTASHNLAKYGNIGFFKNIEFSHGASFIFESLRFYNFLDLMVYDIIYIYLSLHIAPKMLDLFPDGKIMGKPPIHRQKLI